MLWCSGARRARHQGGRTGHGVENEANTVYSRCSSFSLLVLLAASYTVDNIGLDEDIAGGCRLVLPYHASTRAFTWFYDERVARKQRQQI